MDISRMKKWSAGVAAVAISLTQVSAVFAAYSDVPSGVWFESAVESFMDAGYLDKTQTRFRPNDPANRAEFAKLVVELNGGVLSTPPAVASFDDAKSGAWYYAYFEEAGKEGWVRGDGNCYGSHPCYGRPAANINRAEAAALIVRAFGLDATGDAPRFVDNPSGQWYTDVIQTAADHCVLQGDGGTGRVRPGDNMNRAEMVVMLHRVDQGLVFGEDCGTGETPAEAAITDVVATSATTVEIEFNMPVDEDAVEDVSHYTVTGPSGEIDVDSASMVDENTVELTLGKTLTASDDYTVNVEDMMTGEGDLFSDSMSFLGYSPIPVGEGTLEVSTAASNPMGDTVPKGGVGVVMLSLDLTASCDDDVQLTDITILHEGFGDESDIDGVYASVDGGRASRKRTIDSEDQTADLRFSTPLTIAKCQTKTVDVVADFTSTASTAAEHNIAVELPSDFRGNAKAVDGNFPMRGNTFRVASVTSGNITVAYRTVSPDQVEVGNNAVVIGKFELSTDSTEDQTIYSMTFEQNGSASDADMTNLAVRRTDGTVLTNKAAGTVGDFVTLVFDPPFTILEGDKITLEVIGDIVGGAADTVIMHFEERSDIFAVGSLYGYGVNGQLYGSQVTLPTETSSLPDTVTIDAGEFTIEIDGPVQQKFTRDDDDAVLAKILMTTGGETVDLKDLFVAIQGQTSTGAGLVTNNNAATTTDNVHEVLEDVEIRNTKTGQTVSAVRLTGTSDFGTGTASTASFQIYRFDDFTVNGKETWEFRVDFIDNGSSNHPKTGDKFRIHICGQPTSSTVGCDFGGLIATATSYNMKIEGLTTGDNVSDVRPGGTITGNFHRVANPELTVTMRAIGVDDITVKNAKNVQLLRFEARAGEAEDILFTKAIFQANSGSLLNGQNYTLWVDTDGDTVADTILESGVASQSSAVTFDELAGGGYVIPAEETVIFEVRADIAASTTNADLRLNFSTGSTTTFIEAEEADDGSNLSGIKLNGSFLNSVTTADIIVTTVTSKNWIIASQGDLFVIKDTEPQRSRQLLGGALGEPILRLQLRAQNEPIDVTDFQFTSSGGVVTSLDRLDVYKDGATTPFVSATVGGCGTDDVLANNVTPNSEAVKTFCANMESQQLIIGKGQTQDIVIRPRMKADVDGATINDLIQIWLTKQAVADNNTGSGAVRGRGLESSNNLTANDADTTAEGEVFIGTDTATTNANIVGNISRVVFAKITSITNANPDPDNTNVPTGVSPFAQFKFTAAANSNTLNGLNKAVLSGVIFNINATNVTLNAANFKVYNKSDSSTKATCRARSTGNVVINGAQSGSYLVECGPLPATSVNTEMNSGESLTIVLEGDIISPKTGSTTSTLQASLQDFTTLTTTTFVATASHLAWLDKDTATTVFFWVEYPDTVVKSTSYKS
ncbi:MAG: hypothetical protein G01um101425_289 [Candidatus Peregrinibacteria bacterium Gr01-1014_25]|nr:MAG: hypothetical protein G01um101425_289 [Candidatus Peregrinibacteria bacterium Gr01-1014_25]